MPVRGYHRYELKQVRLCERRSNASWFTQCQWNHWNDTASAFRVDLCQSETMAHLTTCYIKDEDASHLAIQQLACLNIILAGQF